MNYIVLNSLNLLYVELLEEFLNRVEFIRFETHDELENYLKVNNRDVGYLLSLQSPTAKTTIETAAAPDALFVRQNDYFKKIRFSDILWIEVSRSYSYIHIVGNSRIITTPSIVGSKRQTAAETIHTDPPLVCREQVLCR